MRAKGGLPIAGPVLLTDPHQQLKRGLCRLAGRSVAAPPVITLGPGLLTCCYWTQETRERSSYFLNRKKACLQHQIPVNHFLLAGPGVPHLVRETPGFFKDDKIGVEFHLSASFFRLVHLCLPEECDFPQYPGSLFFCCNTVVDLTVDSGSYKGSFKSALILLT